VRSETRVAPGHRRVEACGRQAPALLDASSLQPELRAETFSQLPEGVGCLHQSLVLLAKALILQEDGLQEFLAGKVAVGRKSDDSPACDGWCYGR
jgi:hypothetical protein